MNSIAQWLSQLNISGLMELVISVSASLLCITVHETCHGLAALCLGDPTAKEQGRLSLNPLRHVDPMGLVMMALLHFGWARAVPVNPGNFRHPKAGMALTALAGPVSNVCLMLLAVLAYYGVAIFCPEWEYLVMFLQLTAILSAGLAVFNLFPIPPLDGSKILFAVLPDRWYGKLLRYERYGMVLLAVLLVLGVLDTPLGVLRNGLLGCAEEIAISLYRLILQHMR